MLGYARLTGRWVAARINVTSERGASAVEYGILAMLIATVIIVAVVVLGENTSANFDCTGDSWVAQSNQC